MKEEPPTPPFTAFDIQSTWEPSRWVWIWNGKEWKKMEDIRG